MDILVEIFERTKQDLTRKKERVPQRALEKQLGGAATPLPFSNAISNPAKPAPRLIAEIKRRSPSKGLLRPDASPTRLAETYRRSEAAGISILTEPNYFAGSLQDLSQVADLKLGLPLLRKDFLFDPYQLIEARIAGASAVLLITAMLNDEILSELIQFAQELSMTPLVEVHNLEELDRALESGASVLGINNRNLRDFSVHLETSLR
ncbi:MAG: indole-3-glycerol phosphate synthase TrpC, partial [Anaerolineales bacterium]|nr:indole-3-glycerol phosphate synthase TrpC [Anaerolineales bacterium]